MKQSSLSVFALVVILALSCCTSDMPGTPSGSASHPQGTFSLQITHDEVQAEVITRGTLALDAATFQVTLTEADGTPLLEGKPFGTLAASDCTLPSATGYRLKAESCTPEEATTLNGGWGMPHFAGSTTFDILPDQHTPVSLHCTMQNVGLRVIFSADFLHKFPTHALSTLDHRPLVFTHATQDTTAYFAVDGEALALTVKLSGSAGGWDDRLDTTYKLTLSKGKIYTVNVDYTGTRVRCAVQ